MKINEYLEDLRLNLVRRNMQKWLPVWGPPRIGKSTAMYWTAKWIYPDFDVEQHISWTAEDHVDKALHAEKGTVLNLDEPIKGMMSFDATTGTNKDLYRAATVIGERNLIHQAAHVSFKRFPKPFLEDFTEEAIHVVDRGLADLVRVVDPNTNDILQKPQHLDQYDYPPMPVKDASRYEKLKTEFVQAHRDTESYSEAKVLGRQMRDRLRTVLKRHGVEDTAGVDVDEGVDVVG